MNNATLLSQFEPKPAATLDHERQLCEARFSPCGKFLAAGGYDATVQRWEMTTNEEAKKLPSLQGHHAWVQCVAFQPQGERLFSADSWGELRCWKYALESAEPVWSQPAALSGWIRALAVSLDGNLVATAGNDPVVRIWSAADGQLKHELPGQTDDVFSVRFHPDGKSLATGDLKGVVRHWDLEKREVVRQFDASLLYKLNSLQDCGGARVLAFNPSGDLLACGGMKSPAGGFAQGAPCLLLFDWATGQVKQELAIGGNDDGFVYDVAFHEAGFMMVASCAMPGKGHLSFWKPGETQAFFTGAKWPNGRSVSLHPDGKRLAYLTSLSQNGNGRNLKDGEYLGGTATIHLLQFPPA